MVGAPVTFVDWLGVRVLRGASLIRFAQERAFVIAGVMLEAAHFFLEAGFLMFPRFVLFRNESAPIVVGEFFGSLRERAK